MLVLRSKRVLAIAGIALATLAANQTRAAMTPLIAHVAIRDLAFVPKVLHVRLGTTVMWTNEDDVLHTVTSGTTVDDGRWKSSPPIPGGKTFSHTFTKSGRYPYFCKPHFYNSAMHAVIVVDR